MFDFERTERRKKAAFSCIEAGLSMRKVKGSNGKSWMCNVHLKFDRGLSISFDSGVVSRSMLKLLN